MLINEVKIPKFKEKGSEINAAPLYLGNFSN